MNSKALAETIFKELRRQGGHDLYVGYEDPEKLTKVTVDGLVDLEAVACAVMKALQS